MTRAEAIAEIKILKVRLNFLERLFEPRKKRKVRVKKSDDDRRIQQLADQIMLNIQRKSK